MEWIIRWAIKLKLRLSTIVNVIKKRKNFVHYIGGSEALPPPLNTEEEKYYINLLRTDKEQARNVLIERNLRLVVYISRKFENTNISIEDLISIGTIGLIKAVNTFDPDKNIKLATYASRCIENEILMFIRKSSKIKNEISFDEPLNTDWDGNELLLSDILGTEEDLTENNIEREVDFQLLNAAMDNLNKREKTIVELRFGLYNKDSKTQKEVAEEMNISQSYISRLEKKILKRLKKEIHKMTL
ncbi:RNA polymerase sigma-29 (SigE) subunit [Alkalibaculum bacchi]|uniref:RNA polymerase sigma factor n=1 Tax=Alkalibaculum bacchi TaxID=645887 RepID=A0A366I2K9_9FIRM|nr:RNA polymerase sporulation sigma factor SigE [Alkalibaculum bacchi]RBP61819.1 RNA polymerase sigma-29 (SigE) subunit [Alkalibaculum bacchi]